MTADNLELAGFLIAAFLTGWAIGFLQYAFRRLSEFL